MIYFTADLHLFHPNAIKLSGRPFPDMDTMHETLIKNWNDSIEELDEIYIIGDFIWPKGIVREKLNDVLRRLKGDIHLIPGDHDLTRYSQPKLSSRIYVHDKVHVLRGIKDVEPIVMCHWPMRNWPMSHYNSIHLFGHVHNNCRPDPFYAYGRSFNVGVDVWDFRPISLIQIIDKVKTLGDNHNFIKKNK